MSKGHAYASLKDLLFHGLNVDLYACIIRSESGSIIQVSIAKLGITSRFDESNYRYYRSPSPQAKQSGFVKDIRPAEYLGQIEKPPMNCVEVG